MTDLVFAKNDLIYVPFETDAELIREARDILLSATANRDNLLTDEDDFRREMKYASHWRYLWILCHGGDGSAFLYGTAGERLSCGELAENLVVWGFARRIRIILWSCYGRKPGGAAQALWLSCKQKGLNVRVASVAGMTGSIKNGVAQLVSSTNFKFRHGAKGDESLRETAQVEDLIVYPGAPTRSLEL